MTDTVVLQRTVAAPPEQVWQAWTTVDGLATWWWAHLPGTTYAVDLRVGGAYRFEAAAGFGVTGEYVDLVPPARLTTTWCWLDGGVPGDVDEVVVTLGATGAGTVVDLTHVGAAMTPEQAEAYRVGWEQALDALERRFSAGSTSPSTR